MEKAKEKNIHDFLDFCSSVLEVSKKPTVNIIEDTEWSRQRRSFGEYNPTNLTISVYVKNRNTADVYRTIAHELVHHKQNELGRLKSESGKTGSDIENQANSIAGIILREYGKMNELIYENRSHERKCTKKRI